METAGIEPAQRSRRNEGDCLGSKAPTRPRRNRAREGCSNRRQRRRYLPRPHLEIRNNVAFERGQLEHLQTPPDSRMAQEGSRPSERDSRRKRRHHTAGSERLSRHGLMQTSLTKPERETVINWSDDETVAYIWTAQRPVITKLKANKSAQLIQEGFIGSSAWAEFRLPARFVSFRSERRPLSAKSRAKRAANLKVARARKRTGTDG